MAKVGGLVAGNDGTEVSIAKITARLDDMTSKLRVANTEFRTLGRGAAIDPFSNMFKGLPVATTTMAELHAKLTAVYGDLTKLDGKSFGNVTSQLNKYNAELKNGGVVAKNTAGAFDFLGATMGRMAARLTEFYGIRAVLFGVSNQFREATHAAIEHNQAIHDIIAISGDAKTELGNVSDSIYSIAKNSRYSTQEVAGLMQVLAQAGVNGKDLASASRTVGMFADATATDPKLAADLATTAMNNYEIKAEGLSRVTNAMTAALNLSKLEASGLGTAFNYLAPQAAQLGISMEKTLAIIANMAQAGIKASTIGTGMSQFLKELAAPKPRLMKMLEAYGIDPESVNPMKKDFADIIQVLQDKKVSVSDLFSAMETRVGRSAITAVNLTAQSFREMEANLTGTHAALIAYDKTMEGAKIRLNVTKQSFNELATEIGNHMSPALIVGVDAVKDLIGVMAGGHGAVAKLVIDIGLVVAALGTLVIAIKTISLTSIGGAIGSSVTGMVAGIGRIGFAMQALVGGVASLAEAFTFAFGAAITAAGVLSTILTGGIILGIAAGIGTLIYSLGDKRRAEEEATKATLASIDSNEKLGRTYQGIINGTDKTSKAYAEYLNLLKAGKGTTKEAIALKETEITLTGDQRKELQKLVGDGGPLAEHATRLLTQKLILTDLIELEDKRRVSLNRTTLSQVNDHNQTMYKYKQEQLEKDVQDHTPGRVWNLQTRDPDILNKRLLANEFGNAKEYTKARQESLEAAAKYNRSLAAQSGILGIQTQDTAAAPAVNIVPTDDGTYLTSTRLNPPKVINKGRKTGGPKTPKEKVGTSTNTESFDSYYYKENERLIQAKLHADIAADRAIVSNKEETEERRTAALIRVVEANEELYQSEVKASQEKHREKLAHSRLTPFSPEYNDNLLNGLLVGDDAAAKAKRDKDNEAALLGFDKEKKPVHEKDKPINSAGLSKQADIDLMIAMKSIALQKERVWTAQEVQTIDMKMMEAEEANSKKKAGYYQAEIAYWNKNREAAVDKDKWDTEHLDKLNGVKDLNRDILQLMADQKVKMDEMMNANPWTSFQAGARNAMRSATDMNAMSNQLGSSITGSAINGVSDSAFNAFGYTAAKEQQKSDIKTEINKLNIQKAELEGSIASASAGGFRTPDQSIALANQKIQLTGINDALKKQQDALSKVQSSWQNFGEGLKKVMVGILEEIQKYIMRMLVAKIVTSTISFFQRGCRYRGPFRD